MFADEGPGGELVEMGAFERWIEGPAEVFQRAGITESGVLAPLFDEALVPGVEFVLAEQLEAKQLFNLSPDKADLLDKVSAATGISKSQIMNDALAMHYGINDDMVNSRRESVLLALRNLVKPTPKLPQPGAAPSAAPKANAPPPSKTAQKADKVGRVCRLYITAINCPQAGTALGQLAGQCK